MCAACYTGTTARTGNDRIAQVEEGHTVLIGRAGKPVAMLVPYRVDTTPRQLGGTWCGHVKTANDFDSLPPELTAMLYGKSAP